MQYQQLEQEVIDDMIAENMYQREMEHMLYMLNRKNYEHMRIQPNTPPEIVADMEKRIAETNVQIAMVEAVYEGLKSQIVSVGAHNAAIARMKAKRNKPSAV